MDVKMMIYVIHKQSSGRHTKGGENEIYNHTHNITIIITIGYSNTP